MQNDTRRKTHFFNILNRRRGIIAVLTALFMLPLLGMLAFSIDVGYLLKKRAELQRAADAAALAAVVDLVPDAFGNQDLERVRATLRRFATDNVTDVNAFTVLDSDITIGRYDPSTVYTNFTILNDGIFDTVRVTLRRDSSANSPIPLLFGRVFGILESEISATSTAVLQKASILRPGVGVLPFSIPESVWYAKSDKDPPWSIYGDGRMDDGLGNEIAGNWGTLDIGTSSNSTSDLNDQILNGLQQVHLDELHAEGRIASTSVIDSRVAFNANGDTGLSGGIKQSVYDVYGLPKLLPIFESTWGSGGALEFRVVGWGVVYVTDAKLTGNKNSYVKIKKSYTYNGFLRPSGDLSATEGVIDGAYTSPVLVQ